ncbi:hypothetical protein Q3G72_022034 [Acer saccharum]|nr:hypothetical protein Q3G72_022034 [Acer saccharum]
MRNKVKGTQEGNKVRLQTKTIINVWSLFTSASSRHKQRLRFIFFSPMPVSHYLRLSVPYPSLYHVPNTLLWPSSAMMEHTHCQPNTFQANYHESAAKKISPLFSHFNSLRDHPFGALHISLDVGKMSGICNCYIPEVSKDSSEMQTSNEDAKIDIYCQSLEYRGEKYQKEMERRRKIGSANKGRVPWNKGIKHTAETRVRIKQRTVEALRNAKVRMKMAEHPRFHSDESKARIGSTLRHVWRKRLRWKQQGENFILSWSKSIAKAAKDGWTDQQELNWDSYEKLEQEMTVQQLQLAADKVKAKEMAKKIREKAALKRAEEVAMAKAQKMARLSQKRKDQEEKAKAKARREIKRETERKSKKDGELSISQGLKLKRRLTKIHKKKSVNGPVTIRGNLVNSHIPAWEKLDIDLINKEKVQREVSLADQIQAAKNKRMQSTAKEVLLASSSACPFSVRCRD